MKRLCVFCGSSLGNNPTYEKMARILGEAIADLGIGLVYGGASIGIMGAIADSCLEKGGEVIGVIPKAITEMEIAHDKLSALHIVDGMHERKKKMYDLSDGFFAIPGGMGTLDELCEIITWSQLKFHQKPCYVINFEGFFDGLMQHFRYINKEGFLSDEHFALAREFKTFDSALKDFSHRF